MGSELIIATGNAHKLEEIRAILTVPGLELVGLDAVPNAPEVEEDRDTFEGNAIKKAATLAEFTGKWALADDSGLEVDALEGAPGVTSARYAGEPPDYAANNAKLLRELTGVINRTARFRCVMALCSPEGETHTVEGRCEGYITDGEKGAAGFGYDPLFVPEGHNTTFAEMPPAAKNAISHRGRALAKALDEWRTILSGI
ncbi:MAG: XTP/dITP diphosphatase [Kiritimatiellia bacterium]|jgi:XTP/dITP diphosphohydrolase|nr:XTP/dITP diphosphatase [Kiritimatiellia bacterium]MDP6810301.1 XTP/dITP diphosphatase [Kiritimatiellia bacterium]MDP7022710.1 XTP/dITP diphosphatase [Kiritimatiellia bacterium]